MLVVYISFFGHCDTLVKIFFALIQHLDLMKMQVKSLQKSESFSFALIDHFHVVAGMLSFYMRGRSKHSR